MLCLLLCTLTTVAAVAVTLRVEGTAPTPTVGSSAPDDGDGTGSASDGRRRLPNFYSAQLLLDGEAERSFYLNGVAAKETSALYKFNGTK